MIISTFLGGKREGCLLSYHGFFITIKNPPYLFLKCIAKNASRLSIFRLPSSLMSRDDLKFKCSRVFIHSKGCIKLKRDLFFKRILKDRKLISVSGHISIVYDMFKNVALNFPSVMVVEMSQFTVAK